METRLVTNNPPATTPPIVHPLTVAICLALYGYVPGAVPVEA